LTLIAANVFAFLYELSLGSGVDPFLERWGVVPARISGAIGSPGGAHVVILETLVTAMFLHGGWLHLGGNMLFLWIFGDNVEDRLGHALYLLFYLACGVVANLGQVFVDPTSAVPAIGASGAIAGVLGAYAITFPGARVTVLIPLPLLFWPFEVPALIMVGAWFVTQLFSGVAALSTVGAAAGGIAWWAHVAGFATGILLMVVLPKQASPAGSPPRGAQSSRDDTGLVGLLAGTVALLSQLTQVALAARVLLLFLGLSQLEQATPVLADDLRVTTPLVAPFALIIHPVRFLGRPVEVAGVAAIVAIYLIGLLVLRLIDAIAYGRRPGPRLVE
jgi:membrane associated rhomboid family serine protease